jgi:hypothetical protein
MTMAAEPAPNEPPAQDFKAHARDYSAFIKMLKWGAIISAVLGFVVVFLIIA